MRQIICFIILSYFAFGMANLYNVISIGAPSMIRAIGVNSIGYDEVSPKFVREVDFGRLGR
jgi:hypothetical protein